MKFYLLVILSFFTFTCSSKQQLPNVIFILADDLGYGDVGVYNSNSKIPTPNLDRMAKEGMMFTDAHSPSTVCTPTRYSLLTGRMAFRTGKVGVFNTPGGPSMIEKERLTIGKMLQSKGYKTAVVGKWHLGLTFFDKDGKHIREGGIEAVQRIDFSQKIPDSPLSRGFDYFFGTPNCPTTDQLYAYMEGDSFPVPPNMLLDKAPLPKHIYSLDNDYGMIAPDFDLEEVDNKFLSKSIQFIENHSKTSKNQPFFLFHSAQAVHLPSFPSDEFKGKTSFGPHGDFIFQLDHIVGEIIKTVNDNGFGDNTLIIFSSDNGPEVPTVVNMRKDYNHDGAYPLRGVKRDNWEGGHRVPFIAYWPGKIKPGNVSNQMTSLTDLMATLADIIDFDLPNDAGEDSYSILPVFLGKSEEIRKYMIQQSIEPPGSNIVRLSIRKGPWKYLDHKGSGGNQYINNDDYWSMPIEKNIPNDLTGAPGQLYNLNWDLGETKNLYFEYPKIRDELIKKLNEFKKSGRSTDLKEITEVDLKKYEPRKFVSSENDTINYRLFVPENYDSSKKYPLILFHHGAGGLGNDNIKNLESPLISEWAGKERQMRNPSFILSPQIPITKNFIGENGKPRTGIMKVHIRAIHEIIDNLEEEFSIDTNREYITGLSMGGECTWLSLIERPNRFAAAVPICGGDWIIDMKAKEIGVKFSKLPIWVFHGDEDEIVSVEVSRKFVKALQDAGGNPKYTEYKGVNHDSWSLAYRDNELIDWFFSQSKKKN